MRALAVALVFAVTLASADLSAECPPTGTARESVVITTHDGRRLKGVLVCVGAEKAILVSGYTTRNLPRSVIDTIVTTRDSVWNGFAIGVAVGVVGHLLGSYEAHLRDESGRKVAGTILALGAVGALIDAGYRTGGRTVMLPESRPFIVGTVRF